MSKGMLGKLPLSEIRGPRDAFEERLAGEDGSKWLDAFKRFLRKENPWPVDDTAKRPSAKPRKERKRVIDCDALPFVPEGGGLAEAEHQVPGRVTGSFTWDPNKIALHLDPDQRDSSIVGTELIKRLAGKPVLPAQVLDYLLAYPELLPEEWRGKCVFFWGTVYRGPGSGLFVRYLCWCGGHWHWHDDWLGHRWRSGGPAAVSAS